VRRGDVRESMADDDVTLDGDGDDQPDRVVTPTVCLSLSLSLSLSVCLCLYQPDGVVTDGVQRRRRQLARPLRQRLHVQTPRLHRHPTILLVQYQQQSRYEESSYNQHLAAALDTL